MATVGTRNVSNTYFEWAEVDLAAAAETIPNRGRRLD